MKILKPTLLIVLSWLILIGLEGCIDLKPDLEIITGVVYEVNYDRSIEPAADVSMQACAGPMFFVNCSTDITDENGFFSIEMETFDFNPDWIEAYSNGYIDLDSCLRTGGNSYACYIKAEPSLLYFAVEQRLETTDSIIAKVVSNGRFSHNEEILFTKAANSFWEVSAVISGQQISSNDERTQIYFEVETEVPFIYSYKAYLNNAVVFEKEVTTVTLPKTLSEYVRIEED
jgi:hypothetical protein